MDIGGRFHRLYDASHCFGSKGLAKGGQFHKHNVAQRILGVCCDAYGGGVTRLAKLEPSVIVRKK